MGPTVEGMLASAAWETVVLHCEACIILQFSPPGKVVTSLLPRLRLLCFAPSHAHTYLRGGCMVEGGDSIGARPVGKSFFKNMFLSSSTLSSSTRVVGRARYFPRSFRRKICRRKGNLCMATIPENCVNEELNRSP